MKDRRTTRIRGDLKNGDVVIKKHGWFIPSSPKDVGENGLIPWGVYLDGEVIQDMQKDICCSVNRIFLSFKEFKKKFNV